MINKYKYGWKLSIKIGGYYFLCGYKILCGKLAWQFKNDELILILPSHVTPVWKYGGGKHRQDAPSQSFIIIMTPG